jgi:hypothetical protein
VHTYRPRSARITAALIVALATAVAAARILGDGLSEAAPTVGLAALVAIAGVVGYWRPSIGVGQDSLDVRNVLRRAQIPFARVVHVDTKWALELYLDDGSKLSVFVAPAPGAFAARTMRAEDARGLPRDTYLAGTVRPGDRRGTPSGDAAALVRKALEDHRKLAGHDATDPVTRTVDVGAALALAVGLAAAIAGFLV